MLRFLDGFLLTMIAVVVAALLFPHVGAAGAAVPFDLLTEAGIVLVFFLHGANLSPDAFRAGAANWRLHALVQGSTFVLFPLLGLALYVLTAPILPAETRLGLFFLAAVCSTISSSVALVGVARGNVSAAIFNASLSGLIGIVVTPLLIALVRPGEALGALSPWGAMGDIALHLLAPFALGQLLRPLIRRPLARWRPWIGKLDRGVILLIVYTSFCQSTADGIWARYDLVDLLEVFALTAALLAAVLVATTWASRRLGFTTEDEIAAVFCGSKKSLANGAPIAKTLFGASGSLGAVLLPLMIYHQVQLVVCSVLARRYAERGRALPASQPAEVVA